MNVPTARITRQVAFGRGRMNTAGMRTATNRMVTNSRGGTPLIPQSMTTKLKPQTVATRAARSESRTVTGVRLPSETMKHQQNVLHDSM